MIWINTGFYTNRYVKSMCATTSKTTAILTSTARLGAPSMLNTVLLGVPASIQYDCYRVSRCWYNLDIMLEEQWLPGCPKYPWAVNDQVGAHLKGGHLLT